MRMSFAYCLRKSSAELSPFHFPGVGAVKERPVGERALRKMRTSWSDMGDLLDLLLVSPRDIRTGGVRQHREIGADAAGTALVKRHAYRVAEIGVDAVGAGSPGDIRPQEVGDAFQVHIDSGPAGARHQRLRIEEPHSRRTLAADLRPPRKMALAEEFGQLADLLGGGVGPQRLFLRSEALPVPRHAVVERVQIGARQQRGEETEVRRPCQEELEKFRPKIVGFEGPERYVGPLQLILLVLFVRLVYLHFAARAGVVALAAGNRRPEKLKASQGRQQI